MNSEQPTEQSAEPQTKSNPGRTQLILMLSIMVFTLFGSFALFKLAQSTGVWGTVNKGELLQSGISVTDFNWRTVEQAPFAREFPEAFTPENGAPLATSLEGRQSVKRTWWLVAVANEGCGDDCAHALTQLRSLQVLLTKDATRVRRAVLLPSLQSPVATDLAAQFPKMIQLSVGSALEAMATTAVADSPTTGLYIVDPTGVMVLRYPLVGSAPDMQKDLKRLLKYSQLG